MTNLPLPPKAPRTIAPSRVKGAITGSGYWERVAACRACACIVSVLASESPTKFSFLGGRPERVCQGCGHLLSTCQPEDDGCLVWAIYKVSARFHSDSTWYLPWTWCAGTWEIRGEDWSKWLPPEGSSRGDRQ